MSSRNARNVVVDGLSDVETSPYFTVEKFNSLSVTTNSKDKLSCMHCNCRSISKNFQDIAMYMNGLNFQFSIIGLTETWLNDNSLLDSYSLQDYNLIVNNRCRSKGGGVGMFIKSNVKYTRRHDLSHMSDSFESLFIEVTHSRVKHCVVGVIYRPPGCTINEFLNLFESTLQKINNEHKSCVLLGDFNLDL